MERDKKWKKIKVQEILHGHMFRCTKGKIRSIAGIISNDSRQYFGDGKIALRILQKIFQQYECIYFNKYGYDKNNILVGDVKVEDIHDLSEYLVSNYPRYFWYKYGPEIKCIIQYENMNKIN